MILPVIMCGGNGSRLWPLSRTEFPKQFLSLVSDSTMLQDTLARLDNIESLDPLLICNERHRFIVAEQVTQKNIKTSGILLEPISRNTAPAITLAALKAINEGMDPLLLVLAADHVINNEFEFLKSIENARVLAEKDLLVTFGIVPDEAHTGYGYILKGKPIEEGFRVDQFIEKPNLETAEKYFSSGNYFWNSGMFLFKASIYLNELRKYRPTIFSTCKAAISNTTSDLDFIRIDSSTFSQCSDESIDYAVMENTQHAVVIPMDAEWSDIGSWSSLWDINSKDEHQNSIRGDVILNKTNNSYIYSQNRLVAAVGVKNLIVVETKDAVLVSDKAHVQNVKQIVKQLKSEQRKEYLCHREVFRPWGSHDAIASGERYHVKKVVVKPGQRTALQQHFHRAEHWVVVSGTAKVHNGDKEYLVSENESTYIPIGSAHSLENPGKIPLEVIEVRSGGYLGDDDIVRLDDDGVGY